MDSNASEEMDLPAQGEQAKEEQIFLLPHPYIDFKQKAWPSSEVSFPN